MAFNYANLTALFQANGFSLWHYKSTGDTGNVIDTSGYFNGAAGVMNVGDIIIATGSDRTSIIQVLSNTGTVVDCSDGLTVTATNTR
jgi:hypothetical protein